MNPGRRYLVVGGDGLVGRALTRALQVGGVDVTATSRRPGATVALDLTAGWAGDPTQDFDTIVIAAAVASRAACEDDPALSERINVTAPVDLATPVLARGGRVVYLSTHIVLGGDRAFLPPNAPYAPCDAYSQQKARAELALRDLPGADEGLAIVRLTKVVSGDPSDRFQDWHRSLARGQPITPFSDLVLAPVTVDHVVTALRQILCDGTPGLHHLSGAEEVSYDTMALQLAQRLGWDPALIRPQAGRAMNATAAATPPHASLQAAAPQPLADVLTYIAGAAD